MWWIVVGILLILVGMVGMLETDWAPYKYKGKHRGTYQFNTQWPTTDLDTTTGALTLSQMELS